MRGRPLQPAGNYWSLTEPHQEMREVMNRDLADMIRSLRGDPRLSAWEEGFLANVEALLRNSHFHIGLTRKQWDKAWELSDRVASRPSPLEDLPEEAEVFAD